MKSKRICALACGAMFVGSASHALAQLAGNTSTLIRPLVWVRDISANDPFQTAVGLFDTGATGGLFVPPETNATWGIPVAVANPNNPSFNYNIVGKPVGVDVGGIMGGTFSGPEVGAPPTHIYTSTATIASTSLSGRANVAPSLTYYNGRSSFVNVGAGYYNASPAGAPAYVVEVDPTNATWVPFAFNNIAAGAKNGGTPAAALAAPRSSAEQATSSISFYFSTDSQAPNPTANADPGFLTVLPIVPVDLTGAVQASFTSSAGTNGATVGFRPQYTTPVGSAPFGLTPNTSYVVDTGAPITRDPAAGNPGLLGTNILNGFGQYFDFTNNNLMLFGPASQTDKNLVGPGILFTTDRTSMGLTSTGVNQLAAYGSIPVNNANTAAGAAIAGDGVRGQQASAIYRTDLTHSNAAYISGIQALKLSANDHISGLSMGADVPGTPNKGVLVAGGSQTLTPDFSNGQTIAGAITLGPSSGGSSPADSIFPGPINCALLFSVDRASTGVAGSGVAQQTALGKQSAQMYVSTTGNFLKNPGTDYLKYSSDLLGLGPNAGPTAAAAGRGAVDQLGDFVVQSQLGYYGATGARGSVDPNTVQRNIDPTITKPLDMYNPGAAVTLASGTITPPNTIGANSSTPPTTVRGDIYGSTFDTYFTLDNLSPTLAAKGNSAADILVNNNLAAGYNVFAKASTMGLNAGDSIDALALSRVTLGSANVLMPGKANTSSGLIGNFDDNFFGGFQGVDAFNGGNSDYDLFSLAPGSPDLGIFDPIIDRNLSPADVFVSDFDGTFALYATAESLGLNASDNITGLKPIPLSALPEPGSIAILALGAGAMLKRRRSV